MSVKVSTLRWGFLAAMFALLTYGGWVSRSWLGLFLPTLSCKYVLLTRAGDCYLWHFQRVLQNADFDGLFPPLLFFFLLILTLGKSWCGWICPFGFCMDLLDALRRWLRLGYVTFSDKVNRKLAAIRWVFLFILIVVPILCIQDLLLSEYRSDLNVVFCQLCPARYVAPLFDGGWNHLAVSFRSVLGTVMTTLGLTITGLFLVGALVKRRFWCQFCPMGLVIGLCRKLSLMRLKKDSDACTRCGICNTVCPMDIKDVHLARKLSDVTHQDCLLCMRCIEYCPEDKALRATFCGKTIYESSQKGFFSHAQASPQPRTARRPPEAGGPTQSTTPRSEHEC